MSPSTWLRRAPLLLGLVLAAAIALIAALRELTCASCSGGRLPLGVIGATFYTCALIAAAVFGLRRLIAFLLFAAFGVHLGLVTLMVTRGPVCATCLLAAAASLVVVALALREKPDLVEPAIAIAPWMAAAVFLLPIHPAVRGIEVPSTPGASVLIAIYSRDGCAYCDQLRDEVLPEALKGIGDKVEVRWLPAPPMTPTPSILVSRGPGSRLIEGLPPADFLRREVVRLIEAAP